ncbi:hypothetical protein AB6A40_002998 [Gnathostoma spinigerum]|uniref:Amino acid transporter transmembrane domain-containing protein n=1 Tax=Gnathostoma spinigerum TaxID=75299 RepID=A0ABD6E879_9BILA
MNEGRGLGWVLTAFFIVADMVGGGVVAIPVAFLDTGLVAGVILMVSICLVFAYTAELLGENWVIMQERWPQYRSYCRKPYPEMALRSMGPMMKKFTAIAVYATLFGTAIVFILLSSNTISHVLASVLGVRIGFCYMISVMCFAILPLTYLKSPADFWLVVLVACSCTIFAVGLITVGVISDMSACLPEVHYPPFSGVGALVSMGMILFAFSGHHVFPTIQHDMRRPKDFSKSVLLGFLVVATLYMPLSVFGYIVYGESMHNSIINSVQTPWIRHAANLTIAIHCILALIIIANPIMQQAEETLNAPHTFGVTRVIIRTCVLGCMWLCALTVPDFGPFMDLVGATTTPLISVILPCAFNLYFTSSKFNSKTQQYDIATIPQIIRRTSPIKLLWNTLIMSVAICGGLVSAYMALLQIATVKFTPPCYLRPFFDFKETPREAGFLNCCGVNKNILINVNSSDICRM